MGRSILLGFAGPGEVTPNNVKDLLGDYLRLGPEDEKGLPEFADDVDQIQAVFPGTDEHFNPTLEMLLEWVEWADLPYTVVTNGSRIRKRTLREAIDAADEVIETRNINAGLIDLLVDAREKHADDPEDVALIVAWGSEGDDRTELLVDLALNNKLPVLDLTQGLDDLQFDTDTQSEPEPEPEKRRRGRRTAAKPEPEVESTAAEPQDAAEEPAKRPRRGKPRAAAEKPQEPAEEPPAESLEDQVSRARHTAQKPAEPGPDVVMRALTDARWLVRSVSAMSAAMNGLEEPESSVLLRLLDEAIDVRTVEKRGEKVDPGSESEEEPKKRTVRKSGGRPRKDGTPAQERTPEQRAIKEWQNEDGEWVRAGRGRIPKGVHTRTVDPKTGAVLTEE